MKAEELRNSMASRLQAVQEAGNYSAKMARGFARMAGHISNVSNETNKYKAKKGE